jgi:SAM-dependent methyltransferase
MERPMKHEPWQVTAEAAELYERYPVRYILRPWAPLLVDAAGLAAGDRALDVACGTGVVARIAAQRVGPGGRVIGVDLNPGMIAFAGSLPAPVGAPIEWLERSAVDLLLPDASFDAVLCQQGLQFFPDKLVALREMRRVLVHGGRLALSVWNSTGLYNRAVGEALARFVGDAAATKFCTPDKFRPRMNCSVSQQKPVFPTWKFASIGSIFTCRVWTVSSSTIWPEHRSRHSLLLQIRRHASKLPRASWSSCKATPMATGSPTPKKLMF